MSKKIFLQKGSKPNRTGNGRSHVKILLWAALGLIVLVVVAPLITKDKKNKELPKKPESEKGAVVREIPRALQLMQEDALNKAQVPRDIFEGGQAVSGPAGKDEKTAETATAPELATSRPIAPEEDLKAAPGEKGWIEIPREEQAESGGRVVAGVTASGQIPRAEADAVGQPADKVLPPGPQPSGVAGEPSRSPLPSAGDEKPQAIASVEKPPAPAGSPPVPNPPAVKAEPAKPKAPPKKAATGYTVQVGSFKEKSNALEMKKNLERKGYEVVVRSVTHASLGLLHVVQLKPVPDLAKASTLVEQIKMEEKVKPFVVKAQTE